MEKPDAAGHRDRLRRRYLASGLEGFQEDYEVLELLLQFAVPRRDTKAAAKQLLDHFGGLPEVLDASYEELLRADVPHVKDTAAVLITLVRQLETRYHQAQGRARTRIRSTSDAAAVCTSLFRHQPEESVRMICLNASGRVLRRALIADGDVNAVHFPIRRIVETALAARAVSVILTHNHPGGTLTPSREDLAATDAAKTALEAVGIRLLDHIIVSGDECSSLREEGYF